MIKVSDEILSLAAPIRANQGRGRGLAGRMPRHRRFMRSVRWLLPRCGYLRLVDDSLIGKSAI